MIIKRLRSTIFLFVSFTRWITIIFYKINDKIRFPGDPFLIKKFLLWFNFGKSALLIRLINSRSNGFLIMTVSDFKYQSTIVILEPRLNKIYYPGLISFEFRKHVFLDLKILNVRVRWCDFLELFNCKINIGYFLCLHILYNIMQMI